MCAVCLKCHNVINELFRKCTGVEKSRFYIDEGYGNTEEENFDSDGNYEGYFCPDCNEELFCSWEEAEKFLTDKDELKEMIAKKVNQKEVKNGR